MTSKTFARPRSGPRKPAAADRTDPGSPALRFVLLMGLAAMALGLTAQSDAPGVPGVSVASGGVGVFAGVVPPAAWD
jgi:hypothetical protein